MPWTYVLNDLNIEKIVGTFSTIKLQKTYLKEFRTEKVIKRKGDKLYVTWKWMVWMSECFTKPNLFGVNVKVKLDLYNYATQTGLNATGVAKKYDWANLESEVDK